MKSIFRIFFSARDAQNRSSDGAVDIDIVTAEVKREFDYPFFQHGDSDSFYSHGVSIGNTYQVAGTTYMLFMGWKVPEDNHWHGEIGRLIVNQDKTLSLESEKPFLALDEQDPISLSYPWVQQSGGSYQMWYGSTRAWDAGNGEMLHVIKYAESSDGHHWQKMGQAIPHEIGIAQAFSRPTVLALENNRSRMWFSYRSGDGSSYKIGQSCNDTEGNWSEVQLVQDMQPEHDGWDSEMVEYPYVWEHQEQTYMLYNGNGYGQSGFGLATASVGR